MVVGKAGASLGLGLGVAVAAGGADAGAGGWPLGDVEAPLGQATRTIARTKVVMKRAKWRGEGDIRGRGFIGDSIAFERIAEAPRNREPLASDGRRGRQPVDRIAACPFSRR